ncbi:alpha-D-ribose 1-methylphosphonate 5-triphosphate diphosphatase [Roseomonas elaeocarpi]|uniref:Alpha-D-ribose 1-methylphosphonate 5-triphosphate diphosphatase n=1 Tax=Roseomonas elaeocarpi TaxID=907779 RepID=A0ABV6JXL1_9PROT
MFAEQIFTNARIVLPDQVIRGTLLLRGGTIAEVSDTRSHAPGALDFEGDTLIPGIVDLHTDNLERQVQPRPAARWPSRSALLAHDAQTAAAGVTTVFDALCVGDIHPAGNRRRTFTDGAADLAALAPTGALKCDHFLHIRCELPAHDMLPLLEEVVDHPLLRLASLMDHCPGVGQFSDVERFRRMLLSEGFDAAGADRRIREMLALRAENAEPNRAALLARLGDRVPLAAHDDWDAAEIRRNSADGIRISEFPVSLAAAEAARREGMTVIVGAPNLVRGGSHSGNVAARTLVEAGLADAIASDYVPPAMLEAAWKLALDPEIGLARAVAMVTANPAAMAGLSDRGRIAVGLRADLVRVRPLPDPLNGELAVPRAVWRAAERVA